MTAATARYCDVGCFDARLDARAFITVGKRIVGHGALALSAAATVAVAGACVTLTAAWIVTSALSGYANSPVKTSAGEGTFAGTRLVTLAAGQQDMRAADRRPSDLTLEAKVARARALVAELAAAMPPAPLKPMEIAAASPVVVQPSPTLRADVVPIPRPAPARPDLAEPAPQKPVTPAVAALIPTPMPAPEPKVVAQPPQPEPAAPKLASLPPPRPETKKLPDLDGRTAIYDISARTVYMPNGQRLEAHSGLGDKMDDPRHVHVRMRGATPPNVYTLTLREQLFHGVRAIRLNPVDERKMFGRDGMLAHTYMLGPSGQSNGCVSFRDYDKFLRAFLDGEVDRLVVVTHLDGAPPARVARTGRAPAGRYASAEPFDRASAETW
jgi:hypothetical protein